MIFYSGVSNKGDANKNEEYLKNAFEIGSQLYKI